MRTVSDHDPATCQCDYHLWNRRDAATLEPAPANGDGLGGVPATGDRVKHTRTLTAVDLLDALHELSKSDPNAAHAVLGTLTVTAPDALADALDRVRGRL